MAIVALGRSLCIGDETGASTGTSARRADTTDSSRHVARPKTAVRASISMNNFNSIDIDSEVASITVCTAHRPPITNATADAPTVHLFHRGSTRLTRMHRHVLSSTQ